MKAVRALVLVPLLPVLLLLGFIEAVNGDSQLVSKLIDAVLGN